MSLKLRSKMIKISSGFLKFCFRAVILGCRNQIVQKHLQVVPKHGNMEQTKYPSPPALSSHGECERGPKSIGKRKSFAMVESVLTRAIIEQIMVLQLWCGNHLAEENCWTRSCSPLFSCLKIRNLNLLKIVWLSIHIENFELTLYRRLNTPTIQEV